MPSPEPGTKAWRGFTLLELLVVLALLGLLMVLLGSGMRLGGRVAELRAAQELRNGELDPVQNVLRRLLAEGRFIHGDAVSLSLVAHLPRSLADDRLQEIRLTLDGAGQFLLLWRSFLRGRTVETPFATAQLAHDIGGIEIAYYQAPSRPGGDSGAGPVGWLAAWSEKGPEPRLVRVRLLLRAGDPRGWPDLVVQPKIDGAPAAHPS